MEVNVRGYHNLVNDSQKQLEQPEQPDISDAISEFSMFITKASVKNGVMRWAAVNSDTDKDSYQERMSSGLFSDFIQHIQNEDDIPEPFRQLACSDYWCGGMPYMSISHYSDQNGKAVAGEVLELFVDGDKLKAKGVLHDTPLGLSVWKSLREDKIKSPDEKIRISIGFLDLAHKHGDGKVWVRESLHSLCPECLEGVEDKIYMQGYLVHLALTRVPVNKRTEMALEEKSMSKKTRKQDAESIVGEQAELLDKEEKALKSQAMVEMSDSDEEKEPKSEVEGVKEPVVEDAVAEGAAEPTQTIQPTPAVSESAPEPEQKPVIEVDASTAVSSVEKSAAELAVEKMDTLIGAFESVLAEKSRTVAHPLQHAIDEFLTEVDNSAVLKSEQERAGVVNPAFQKLGTAISDYLTQKSVGQSEQSAPENKEIVDEIRNLTQLVSTKMEEFNGRLGLVEAQRSQAIDVRSDVRNRVPVRKSLSPEIVRQATPAPKVGLSATIRKSFGLQD